MNIDKNFLIIIEPTHPHHTVISSTFNTKNTSEALSSYQTYDYVIDLTILTTKKKLALLKELTRTTRAPIISELTCCFQEKVFLTYPQVIASLSTFFHSPTSSFEYFIPLHNSMAQKDLLIEIIDQFYRKIKFIPIHSQSIEFTFTMPRIVSQIINEAFFALEENLSTPEGIDLAMVNGVNYPIGPLLWAKKTGIKNIQTILEELYKYTKDNRYRPSLHLVKATLKKEY